jgi:hypothetical protein
LLPFNDAYSRIPENDDPVPKKGLTGLEGEGGAGEGNETGARRGKIAPRRDNREEIAFGIINYPRKCENGRDI